MSSTVDRLKFLGVLCKGTSAIHEHSTLMTYSPPKGSPPNAVTLGVHTVWCGGTQAFNLQQRTEAPRLLCSGQPAIHPAQIRAHITSCLPSGSLQARLTLCSAQPGLLLFLASWSLSGHLHRPASCSFPRAVATRTPCAARAGLTSVPAGLHARTLPCIATLLSSCLFLVLPSLPPDLLPGLAVVSPSHLSSE